MNARDIMTEGPLWVRPTTTVGAVVDMLIAVPIRHVLVVEGGQVIGMVNDRDLRSLMLPKHVDAADLSDLRSRYVLPISDLMTCCPITAHPETSVTAIIDLMLAHNIGTVPILDSSSGDLVGVVSYVDILKAHQSKMAESA